MRLPTLQGLRQRRIFMQSYAFLFISKKAFPYVKLVSRDLPIIKEQRYNCYQRSPSKGHSQCMRLPILCEQGRVIFVHYLLLDFFFFFNFDVKKLFSTTQTCDLLPLSVHIQVRYFTFAMLYLEETKFFHCCKFEPKSGTKS